MALRTYQVALLTDGAGAQSKAITAPGKIVAVGLVIGSLSTPDVTLTDDLTGGAIFAKASIASSGIWQPKVVAVSVAAAALNTAGDVAYDSPACLRALRIVVAGGGDTKAGTLYVLVEN